MNEWEKQLAALQQSAYRERLRADLGTEIDQARGDGRLEERAAIITFLRQLAQAEGERGTRVEDRAGASELADKIERVEHIKPAPGKP